jgi:hypothetical protein
MNSLLQKAGTCLPEYMASHYAILTWTFLPSGLQYSVVQWKSTNIEAQTASIFRDKETAKQKTSRENNVQKGGTYTS